MPAEGRLWPSDDDDDDDEDKDDDNLVEAEVVLPPFIGRVSA